MPLAKGSSTGKVGGRAYGTGKKGFPTRGPVPYNSGGSGRGAAQNAIRGKSVQKAADKSWNDKGRPSAGTAYKTASGKAKSIAAKQAKKVGAEGPKRSAPVKKKGTR